MPVGHECAGLEKLLRKADVGVLEPEARVDRQPLERPLVLRIHAHLRVQIFDPPERRGPFGDLVRHAVVKSA
jgi:hypothetical protein